MKFYIRLFLFFSLLASCDNRKEEVKKNTVAEQLELVDTDKSFSELCIQKGMKNAFIEVLDSNAVLIRSNSVPIAGANAIDFLIQQEDADFIYSRKPQHADLSESGEIGYTYGVYEKKSKLSEAYTHGSYVSIWKKQSGGIWKLLLDSENVGLGE